MAKDRILRKPLLRAPLSEFVSEIERLRITLQETVPWYPLALYHCRLSNLLSQTKPRAEPLPSDAKSDGYSILRLSVDVALFQIRGAAAEHNIKLPCAAFDLRENWSEEKAGILEAAHIDYGRLPDDLPKLQAMWESPPRPSSQLNKKLDDKEIERIAHLDQRLKPLGMLFLPQQGLSSLLDIPGTVRAHLIERIRKFNRFELQAGPPISEELDALTTIDGVVATKPPASIPVAAIEFDGGIHRSHESDDAGKQKREKDKIKNGIFERARLPLIRIATGDDITGGSRGIGDEILDSLLGELRNLMLYDAQQSLVLQEMLFSEVRQLKDSIEAANLYAIVNETLSLLDAKAQKAEQAHQDALRMRDDQREDNLMDSIHVFDPYDELPVWQTMGYESEADFQAWVTQQSFEDYRQRVNNSARDGLPFFVREVSLKKRRECGWGLVAKYTPSTPEAIKQHSAVSFTTIGYESKEFVPILVFGSGEWQVRLRRHAERRLRDEILEFEDGIRRQLSRQLLDAIDATESAYNQNLVEARKKQLRHELQEASGSAFDKLLRDAVGLSFFPRIHLVQDRKEANKAVIDIEVKLMDKLEYWLSVIAEDRGNEFDAETIAMFRADLAEDIRGIVAEIEFFESANLSAEEQATLLCEGPIPNKAKRVPNAKAIPRAAD